MALIPVSQENILGSLIPDVYINGVTLETSGSPVKESNPHIDHTREMPKQKLPEQLVVTVDLSLKEKLDDSLISSWFGEQEFTKYLKIKIIQSRGFEATKLLTHNKLSIVFPASEWWDELTQGLIETRILTVAHDVVGDGSNLTQHRSHVDSDGVSIHDINYRAVFYIPDETPEHLAYFVVSYIDMEQLVEDFKLKVDQEGMNKMNGKVASDIIIHNNEVVSTAWVYRTRDGLTWTGPIHKQKNVWMSGSKPAGDSMPLQRIKVSSTKVQDFRDVKEVEKLQIDLAVFDNSLMTQKNKLKLKTNDNTDVRKKKTYFTDVHISRDSDGSARLSFGLDFKQYIKENSVYGKLFDSNVTTIRKGIFESAKIRTMKVYRRRVRNVQTLNRLGSPWHGEVVWDKAETPVLLAVSGERDHKDFRSVENDLGSLKEISYVMKSNSDMEDMRFFTVMDKTIKDVTDGHYQYGVELEVEDGSFNYLAKWAQRLLKQRRELFKYYQRGSKPGMTKLLMSVDDPHIDHEAERLAEQSKSSGTYEPTSNRFTKSFFLKETEDWKGQEIYAPWFRPAWEYLVAVHLMTQSIPIGDKFLKLLWSLCKIINPQTGNPKGVMALIGLLDNLISKIQRVLAVDSGTRTVRTIDTPPHPQTKIKGKTSKTPVKIFRDRKWFTNASFDTNIEKNAGLRYLWMGELETADNTDGLKEIDGGYYQARVNVETRKYFKSLDIVPNLYAGSQIYTDGDSLSATSFTFLTPSMIELPNLSMKLVSGSKTKDPYGDDYYSNVESCVLAYNSGYNPTANMSTSNLNLSPEAQTYSYNMTAFFGGLNTTVLPIDGWEPIALTDHLKGRAVSISHASGSLEPPEPPKPIDPIVEIHTSCATVPTADVNSNPNSVFLGLSQFFLKSGATTVGNSNPFASSHATSGKLSVGNNYKGNASNYSMTMVDSNTIEMYNLNGNNNAVALMAQDGEMAASILNSNGYNNAPATIETALLTLPNQVKCLFLGSTSPSFVKHKWHQYGFDPVKNLMTAAKFRLNHQLIVRVDRLAGYEKSFGRRHVKQSKWEPLTKAAWADSAGEAILCRFRKYINPQIGIRWLPGLALPMYDEYFVLVPPSLGAPPTTIGGHPIDDGPAKPAGALDTTINEAEPGDTQTNHLDC